MPTLLQINVTANWGSTGKIAEQIGLRVMSYGWESYVAHGRMANPSKNKLIKIGSIKDVYRHYLEGLLLDNEGLASRRATKAFLKKMDELRPDIVHLHNIHDHYMNYELLLSYLAERKISVVWTQHDEWIATGHCMYVSDGCERWQTECHDCPLSRWYSLDRSRRNHNLKKKLLATLPSLTIVPVSNWLGDNIRKSYLKDRPVEVIHNGIDIHDFRPIPADVHSRYGVDEGKKIILGVAAVWSERKGLVDFYDLAKRLPRDEYAIVIVGRVKSRPQSIKDGCQMVFVDRTQNILELAQLYSAAFVFVNPTYQDNYPTTNLEALACGTPVITYRTGGSPEAVDEQTGVVVDQGDVVALATTILKMKDAPLSSIACRDRAERHFDKDKCFERYVELYKRLLSS